MNYFSSRAKRWFSILAIILVGSLVYVLILSPTHTSNTLSDIDTLSRVKISNVPSSEVVFPVDVALARKGDLVKRLNTNGLIRAKREVEIVARVSGEITSTTIRNGRYVTKGDILLKIDDRGYQLAYEKTSTALLSAQIEYRTLTSSPFLEGADSLKIKEGMKESLKKYSEAEKKFKIGLLSREEFLRAQREFEADQTYYGTHRNDVIANKSGLSQAREAYELAKMNLEWTEIRAQFAGYVADFDLVPGMQVQIGKTLLKLVDVSSLLVDVEVLESEIGKIKVGRKAEVSVNAYPKEKFYGTIQTINPLVDSKSKTIKVTVELKDGRPVGSIEAGAIKLRPGMFTTVRLETDIFKDRFLVPKEALLVRDQRTLVFVAEGNLAKWHYVDVGEENEEFIEIISGIAAGDTVIVGGHYTLAHDARVKVQEKIGKK